MYFFIKILFDFIVILLIVTLSKEEDDIHTTQKTDSNINIISEKIIKLNEDYNFENYKKICLDNLEFEKCKSLSSYFLSELKITTLSQLENLSLDEKKLISSIYYNLGFINYYGLIGNENPNLPRGVENIIISSYLGNEKAQYLLYILIENELLEQIIYAKDYNKILLSNPLLKEISTTKFYNNLNFIENLNNINLNNNSSKIAKSSIALSFLYSSTLSQYPPALNAMAFKYLNGYGLPKSCETSLKFYKESAYETIKDITFRHTRNLYKYYSLESYEYVEKKFTTKVPNNAKEELEFYRVKASNGDIESIRTIAKKYLYGDGIKQNLNESYKWFEMGYKLNDSMCVYYLGEMYLNGWGVGKDYTRAYDLLMKASFANYSKAWNSLGFMYYYGYGVNKDLQKAYDYFKISVSKFNDEDGYYDLLTMLIEGNEAIPNDFGLAYKYANLLAMSGHTYGTYFFAMLSHYNIGSMINVCDINIQFFKTSAEKNIYDKIKYDLALNYYYVKKYKNSLLLFMELAEEGFKFAQLNTALLLRNYDIFIDKDYQKYLTVKYMKMAANSDNSYANLLLGDFYLNGYGNIKINYDKALYYYKKVIQTQGVSQFIKEHATFNIGLMNSFGLGMEKNITKALSFYNISLTANSAAKYPSHILIKYDELFNNGTFVYVTARHLRNFCVQLVYPYWKIYICLGFFLFYFIFYISIKSQDD